MTRNLIGLFGVNEYLRDRGLRSLRFCSNDAALLLGTLTTALSSLEIVASEFGRVSGPDFDAAISLIQEMQLNSGDQVILFFAGHGFTSRGADYIAFSDSNIDDPTSWRSVTELQERLRESGAGKVLMILDCCREIIERGRRDIEEFRGVATQDAKLDVVLFIGCRISEVSQEHPEVGSNGNGIFTSALCSCLAEDSTLSLQRLERSVQERAALLTTEKSLRSQHPQVVGPFAFASMDIFGREADVASTNLKRPPRMIIITGATQAGKTTVGRRLQELLGFRHIEMSGYVVRRYRHYVEAGHQDSVQDFVENSLWKDDSEDVIARDVLADLEGIIDDVIITGGRTPAEMELLRSTQWDVVQTYQHANAGMRWRRAVEATDDYANQRYEAFVHRNLREFGWGLARTGTMKGSRIVLNEHGELEGVHGILHQAHLHGWTDLELDLSHGDG